MKRVLLVVMVLISAAAIISALPAISTVGNANISVTIGPNFDPFNGGAPFDPLPDDPLPEYYLSSVKWTSTFNIPNQNCANDYHVSGQVLSFSGLMPVMNTWSVTSHDTVWTASGYAISQNPSDSEVWDFSIDFKTDGCLHPGDTLELGLTFFLNNCNGVAITACNYTHDGVNIGEDVFSAAYSFEVVYEKPAKNFSDEIVLTNHMPVGDLNLLNLELTVSDTKVELYQMNENYIGLPGHPGIEGLQFNWIPAGPALIHLAPGQSFHVNYKELGVPMEKGKYLLYRGVDQGTGKLVVGQHEG